MIAEHVVQKPAVMHRVIEHEFDAALDQPPPVPAPEFRGTEVIQQQLHVNTAPHRVQEGVDKARGHGARLEQVDFQQYITARRGNGLEHAREELPAIHQQFKMVAATPGEKVLPESRCFHSVSTSP